MAMEAIIVILDDARFRRLMVEEIIKPADPCNVSLFYGLNMAFLLAREYGYRQYSCQKRKK